MTRKMARAVGIAAVVALGLLALASAAQAAEFGRCVSSPTGEYAIEGCTDQAAIPHSGSYEWEPPEGGFSAIFGTSVGETPSVKATTTCKAGTAAGTVSGPKTSQVVDTFTGCEGGGKQCHTLNTATAGEIRTFTLEGTLIEHGEKGLGGKEPEPGEVWNEFADQHGTEAPLVDTYLCEGLGYFLLKQWVGTSITPLNVMAGGFTQTYEPDRGEQGLLSTGCEKSNFTGCYWENASATFTSEDTIFAPEPFEIRTNEPPAEPPEAGTGAATEVTSETATVNGYVVPNGESVTECEFEFGPSEGGAHEERPCSSLPGSGHDRVQVSAQLPGGLVSNHEFFFRISATTKLGTSRGAWNTFTTLQSSASGETTGPMPATATDGELSVEASGGTGAVTIGQYGSEIGGPALAGGKGAYFQVYHSAGATFTTMKYSDCELGGEKTLWWDDPATGWEPIAEPTAVYDEATKCVTVTATETTRPSVAQLSDPRHVGGPAANEEFGKCEPAKDGHFEDAACTKEKFKEKGGVRSYKGKYEWLAAPVGCFAQKKGRYADSGCTTLDEKKNKPKGKYESGLNTFTGSGTSATLHVTGLPALECQSSTSTGSLRAPNETVQQITFSGCESSGAKCASAGQAAGTVVSEPLESYTYEESGKYLAALNGDPIMSFSCGNGTLTLSGGAAGGFSVPLNILGTTSEATFGPGDGEQLLQLEEVSGKSYPATITTVIKNVDAQAIELRAKP